MNKLLNFKLSFSLAMLLIESIFYKIFLLYCSNNPNLKNKSIKEKDKKTKKRKESKQDAKFYPEKKLSEAEAS